jgi:hypothetical protein
MMLSYQDIVCVHTGRKGSRLESALRGPMSRMLCPEVTTTRRLGGGRQRPG